MSLASYCAQDQAQTLAGGQQSLASPASFLPSNHMAVLSPFLELLAAGAPAQVVPALNQPIPLLCMAGSSHSSLLGGLATLGSGTDPSPVVSFMARYSSTDPLPVSQAWAPLENPLPWCLAQGWPHG